ncbi:MAG: hypothetical protein KAG53_06410 [Endozoicomonadaceae bacterium]|nr:hypothetical protein [Endozoicomonadaceae bacterium]
MDPAGRPYRVAEAGIWLIDIDHQYGFKAVARYITGFNQDENSSNSPRSTSPRVSTTSPLLNPEQSIIQYEQLNFISIMIQISSEKFHNNFINKLWNRYFTNDNYSENLTALGSE